jgi:hypothetical protein
MILHEIAQALIGPNHGHDRLWRATAEAVGGLPQRCYSAQAVRVPPACYRFECPACGHTGIRMRIRVSSCGRCDREQFNSTHLLRWIDLRSASVGAAAAAPRRQFEGPGAPPLTLRTRCGFWWCTARPPTTASLPPSVLSGVGTFFAQ